jgi:hypothetical protein
MVTSLPSRPLPTDPGRRFARGTRTGSPAVVWSPRTGSATIWAACLPTAHPSVLNAVATSGSGAASGDGGASAVALVADDVVLRNQFDVAGPAGCAISRGPAAIGVVAAAVCVVTTASVRPFAGW